MVPSAVCAAVRSMPDVVLMDLRMPGGDGVTATAEITQGRPSTRVLVLTTYDTDSDILRAVEAGATGYLLKDVTGDRLVEAVRAAARGETVLAAPVAARLMRHLRAPEPESLTPRELDVLKGAARGLSNIEIGRDLHIGSATVKSHLIRVFAKLGVESRTASGHRRDGARGPAAAGRLARHGGDPAGARASGTKLRAGRVVPTC